MTTKLINKLNSITQALQKLILDCENRNEILTAATIAAILDTDELILMTETENEATPPEERTDILYLPEVDGGAEGWYHTTEDDTEGPYRTRDEALFELGKYREKVRLLDLIRYN